MKRLVSGLILALCIWVMIPTVVVGSCDICRCFDHQCIHAGAGQSGSQECNTPCNCPITLGACLGRYVDELGDPAGTEAWVNMTPVPESLSDPVQAQKCGAIPNMTDQFGNEVDGSSD